MNGKAQVKVSEILSGIGGVEQIFRFLWRVLCGAERVQGSQVKVEAQFIKRAFT